MNLFAEAIAWLTDAANWGGSGGIGARLFEHIWYTLLGLLIASVVAIPAGLLVGHTGRGRGLVVGISGAARALPTLGVITLVGVLIGIGLTAPMVAFVILAIPSVLAGAYSGVESVNRATVDAARSIGFTEWQILTRVEIPLAWPLILGGLRAAALQVIATATLASYVGAGGLGRFLFLGLNTQDYGMMLGSSLVVIALAIAFEVVFGAAGRLARRSAPQPAGAT